MFGIMQHYYYWQSQMICICENETQANWLKDKLQRTCDGYNYSIVELPESWRIQDTAPVQL